MTRIHLVMPRRRGVIRQQRHAWHLPEDWRTSSA
jgi:hypothetical protein